MTSRTKESRGRSGLANGPIGRAVQHRLAENSKVLAKTRLAGDVLGKVWNAPNTAIGLGYGLAGYAAGQLNRLRPGDQPDPRIRVGNNAVEFVNNPFGGAGAITLGNTITYDGDPYDPNDEGWNGYRRVTGQDVRDHERQHTYQGQQLGPLYLPSNLLGGLRALAHDRYVDPEGKSRPDWHGARNWNERGPQSNPPRPWSPKIVR